MMRPLFVTICALAALTAACDGDRTIRITSTHTGEDGPQGVLKVVDGLQCPQTMGSLTRKGTAHAGGNVCTYVGAKGAEVSLHLIRLETTSVDEVLQSFQTRLSGEMPLTIARLRAAEEAAAADAAAADLEAARADVDAAHADAAAADSTTVQVPGVHIESHGDTAEVKLPGINIQSHGDRSHVRIGGINIQSSDGSGTVDIRTGEDHVSIQSHADSTEVRTSTGGDATRITWILSDPEASASGWRLVGYEARGPQAGPVVVATVRSRDSERGRVFADARDLVTLNVGR